MASQKLKIVSLELKLSIVEILALGPMQTVLLASLSDRNLGSGCLIIVSSL